MKATTWFCPVLLTLLCAARLVCTAQRGGYAGLGLGLDYMDANVLQDDYLLEKRNKPSLSIVNPLDVLRQRLLLEIARRQMKDTTRQVELNRAILKNVGKRMLATRQHFPSELFNLALPPPSTFSDFLQGQQQQQRRAQYDLPEPQFTQTQPVFISDILDDAAKKSQSDQPDSLTKHQANGNEISNETNKQKLRAGAKAADVLAVGRRIATGSFGPNDFNWSTNDDDNVDDGSVNGNGNGNGEAFHFPYLQQLRKKHFAN